MPPRDVSHKARPQPRALAPEDFDAIQEAVMETQRGRWFLDEYAQRLRKAETASLVAGMSRLEKAVGSNHDALMARLAAALERGTGEARASAPQPEMERGTGQAPAASTPKPDLAPRHMKYYRNDEDIFEPAPHAQIAAVPAAPRFPLMPPDPLPPVEAEAAPKRRIVVIRHKPGDQIDVPLADEMAKAS